MNQATTSLTRTDVLTRLPTHKASRIAELLPHKWAGVREG